MALPLKQNTWYLLNRVRELSGKTSLTEQQALRMLIKRLKAEQQS